MTRFNLNWFTDLNINDMQSLGGSLIVRDGIKFDYNFVESINCLLGFCDQVAVIDGGSTDGTAEVLKTMDNPKLKIKYYKPEDWTAIEGKEKLVWFTDRAIEMLDTDWNFYLQADEILHERSYSWVRKAIEDKADSYLCRRINLWGNPFTQLNVPQNRMPCSEIVCRLARTKYRSYGDAESLRTDGATCGHNYIDAIVIYHMGFVRKREVMKAKIINMQEGVFGMSGHDAKLDGSDVFQPELWFSGSDLMPITEPLPRIIQHWALERM